MKSNSERSTRGRSRGKGRRGRGRGERDWGSRSYDDEPDERSKSLKPVCVKLKKWTQMLYLLE